MLTLLGNSDSKNQRLCDSFSRRGFLKIGGLAMGGLSLAQLLQMEALANTGAPGSSASSRNATSQKALINIYLPGGPSHIDLWDPKPDAPSEIRGEFSPIKTNVSGIEICELFPRMAKMMDKFIPIRSVVGSEGRHAAFQCMTGRTKKELTPSGGWPAAGAYISKLQGQVTPDVPQHVSLMYQTSERRWGDPGNGGFLGQAHAPTSLISKKKRGVMDDMVLKGITLERLHDRHTLLASLDNLRRDIDNNGQMEGADRYTQQAMDILTSSRLLEALDLSREDPKTIERYGKNDPKFQLDGAPRMVQNFLIARRLVEAGARIVSLNYSRWDWHGGDGMNFLKSRDEFPRLDQALCALVTDLHERGLDKDVTVIVWGEFGRTPKINGNNSRDHWPRVSCAMMAGGGMRTGQVIGSTNKHGEYAKDRPVSFADIFATIYHNLGVNCENITVPDLSGRPQYLLEPEARVIHEVI